MKRSAIKIRIKLLERGITQQQIADMLGISIQAVNNVIVKGSASMRVVNALAMILNTTPGEIRAIIQEDDRDVG
ncbi:MAG: helix-turn-helix transcriptional regulator [Syntrophales bacterium]|jgi:predicted transcriptional regulator|nr:helix-turn-helix transcriptional regulator [Syntrophales bacterium]